MWKQEKFYLGPDRSNWHVFFGPKDKNAIWDWTVVYFIESTFSQSTPGSFKVFKWALNWSVFNIKDSKEIMFKLLSTSQLDWTVSFYVKELQIMFWAFNLALFSLYSLLPFNSAWTLTIISVRLGGASCITQMLLAFLLYLRLLCNPCMLYMIK